MNNIQPVIRPMQDPNNIPVITLPIQQVTPPTTPIKSQQKKPPVSNNRYRPYAVPHNGYNSIFNKLDLDKST